MKIRRTDLAVEARELWQEGAGQAARLPGVTAEEGNREGIPVTTVRILDEEGEKALGKPRGNYVTLTLDGVARREEDIFGRAARAALRHLEEDAGRLSRMRDSFESLLRAQVGGVTVHSGGTERKMCIRDSPWRPAWKNNIVTPI